MVPHVFMVICASMSAGPKAVKYIIGQRLGAVVKKLRTSEEVVVAN
jgi:hypothetical protein